MGVEKQQQIARKNEASAQRQNFANGRQGPRRPVFNAANFNPNRPASDQFNTQNFNRDFNDFQGQQQQFQQTRQFQQNQQFAQNPQQFAPQQNPQFAPQQQQQQIPLSELTREQIALQGFSRDDDQDGQIDPLPAHLQPQQQQQFAPQQQQQFAPQQQQQFVPQQQQFAPAPQQPQQPQQFFQQQQQPQQQSFRTPQPVGPSPVGQPQFTQQQLQQLFSQSQPQQRFQ